eukprot:gene12036-12179_t
MSVMKNFSVALGSSCTLATLEELHTELLSVLQQAQQPSSSDDPPTTRMQSLTGCSRREAQYYLQQARFDMQTAVAYWHNQVLREFLAAYTASNPASISFRQHVVLEAADSMRSRAKQAADAATAFEPAMTEGYLRTNFCSICKVERDVADLYLKAAGDDIVAAVEQYIARHILESSGC